MNTEQVFIKLRSGYGGCLFLANEREQSRKHGFYAASSAQHW